MKKKKLLSGKHVNSLKEQVYEEKEGEPNFTNTPNHLATRTFRSKNKNHHSEHPNPYIQFWVNGNQGWFRAEA